MNNQKQPPETATRNSNQKQHCSVLSLAGLPYTRVAHLTLEVHNDGVRKKVYQICYINKKL